MVRQGLPVREHLEDHQLSGIANDLTDMIRRNPVPALLVGIGIGYLLARATSSNNRS